jgi:hypothetical protein
MLQAVMPAINEGSMEFDAIVRRVRGEFLEMPGLSLTFAQAERLWGLEEALCQQVIGVLIGASFLRQTPAGAITRADR